MRGTRPTSLRWAATAAFILAALLLAGACAPPPPAAQMQLYADTAQQTRTAGGMVLDRIAPIIAQQGSAQPERDCGPDERSGIPRCFDLLQVSAGDGASGRADPPAVAIHRTALDLVAAYARILADLAEGKSAADIQTNIGAAAAIAGTLATLTGVAAPVGVALAALTPQIQALAGRLEAARAGQLVRQSIIADKETIQAVLKALEDGTPAMYDIYRNKRQLDRKAALEAFDRNAANAAVEDIKRFHAALEAYVRLLRATSAALDTLARDAQQPVQLNAQSAQAALKQAVDARAEALVLLNTVRQLGGRP
jgi:hypothetical protein